MNDLTRILHDLQAGDITIQDALNRIMKLSAVQVADHTLFDTTREHRVHIPEIIYAERKTLAQLKDIINFLSDKKNKILLSRVPEQYYNDLEAFITKHLPSWRIKASRDHRTILLQTNEFNEINDSDVSEKKREAFMQKQDTRVLVIAAGTSDHPVYEEILLALEYFTIPAKGFIDVGIAGIHRLKPVLEYVKTHHVQYAIVIAGMEGALPTLLNSLLPVPVIGVPTSVGYGLGGKGVTALLSMLQSCSPGLVTVNIDAGIQAASFVAKAIKNQAEKNT